MKYPTIIKNYRDTVGLFKTDIFHDHLAGYRNPWLKEIINKFFKTPKIVCEYTDQSLEHSHFYAYLGIIPERHYDNPYIHDLYMVHELYHAGSMPYMKSSFEEWANKIKENELAASIASEVFIYFKIPKLRELSFPFEIWFDRFKDLDIRLRTDEELWMFLEGERRKAYTNPKDKIEKDIQIYNKSNDIWVEIWKESKDIVEDIMIRKQNYHPQDQAQFVLDSLLPYTTDGIPFKSEALKFKEALEGLKTNV